MDPIPAYAGMTKNAGDSRFRWMGKNYKVIFVKKDAHGMRAPT
jgi:hypothetical protein